MACFSTGQGTATVANTPVPVTTVPLGIQSISLVTNATGTPAGVYVGNSPTMTASTGFFIPANFPVSLDIYPNNSTLYVLAATGTTLPATVHFIMGS